MDDDYLDEYAVPGTPSSRHALLAAALLHLMSQYTLSGARPGAAGEEGDGPCLKLASVIQRHMDALARLPDAEPVLRATCEQLSLRWADLVESRLPPPRRRPFLARLLGQQRRTAAPALAG